jgi:hypothetical protein
MITNSKAMKRPFNIFPSIGYRNSQFQIVSTIDNLKIDIYDQNKLLKSIVTNSQYPTLITSLKSTGKLIAKCKSNNELFQQEIEIKDAFRLGSSVFKKAFIFDDTDYSFFLMKDRLLLFDEKKKILLTENHYSPTIVNKINKSDYLFITKVGSSTNGIINLGIYNTKTFSIVGELLNDYQEIKILPDTNKAWLFNRTSNSIHCFELIQASDRYFSELKKYESFSDFFTDNTLRRIFINYPDKLIICDIHNLDRIIEIPKNSINAIDKQGNTISIDGNRLTYSECFTDLTITVIKNFEINLQAKNFIHIGNNLKSNTELTDLNKKVDEIKNDIISSIPEDKAFYHHSFPDDEKLSEISITHDVYPTINGIYVFQKRIKRDFNGIYFRKEQTHWISTPDKIEYKKESLLFLSSNKVDNLLDKENIIIILDYNYPMLRVSNTSKTTVFSGHGKLTLDHKNPIKLFSVNKFSYCLVKLYDKHTLFLATDLENPILERIIIQNYHFEKNNIIWYSVEYINQSDRDRQFAFDLESCSNILVDQKNVQHYSFEDESAFTFDEGDALSSNQFVFNPKNQAIKDASIVEIQSTSEKLDKLFSYRKNIVYLYVFNYEKGNYELTEIPIDEVKYKESYLSPDGQFLVLQDGSNKYLFYDIEKNETIRFISGIFLAFRNDGSIIVEQDGTKAVKIYDPKTFEDITPANYHQYRFLSPDSKLYAQVSSKIRYINKLNEKELTENEVSICSNYLKKLSYRRLIFSKFKAKFKEFGIEDYTKIDSSSVIRVEKYTEIGIVGTNVSTEILFPRDLVYYNYAAFSYDNKYFGYVGKPSSNGLIHLFKIDFDEANSQLKVTDTYLSRYPTWASWVCGFSKTGYFATYDSTPNTYILFMDDDLFTKKPSEIELRENIYKSKSNLFHSYNRWNEIKGKNFLCFSPSGDFLALSEQGYEPLTLGGYGHQESNVVHIAKTTSGEIRNSFIGHGDKIEDNKTKKVTFVAFSEDEKRIMTLSSDGVVIIRDLNMKELIENKKKEELLVDNIL